MIGNLDDLGPWRSGEDWRMVPCNEHAMTTARLLDAGGGDDSRARDIATDCPDCCMAWRPR